jgi:hypothetical protein
MEPFVIANGPYTTLPTGRITAFDGHTILLWSSKPEELLSVMIEAIGPMPDPVAFGLGGQMEVSGMSSGGPWGDGIPEYTYNPGGDVLNQSLAAEFTARVTVYNARIAAVQAVILAMIGAKKE